MRLGINGTSVSRAAKKHCGDYNVLSYVLPRYLTDYARIYAFLSFIFQHLQISMYSPWRKETTFWLHFISFVVPFWRWSNHNRWNEREPSGSRRLQDVIETNKSAEIFRAVFGCPLSSNFSIRNLLLIIKLIHFSFSANSQAFPIVENGTADSAIIDYIGPNELKVGQEVSVNGHRFLLVDCDPRTRQYYSDVLKVPQDEKVNIDTTKSVCREPETPEYWGFGTPEDSMQSCFRLVPRPPRKNIKQFLLNANKYLRFSCVLDTAHPEDMNRKFILKYALSDGKLSIIERPQSNSGIPSGKFLAPQLVVIPGSDPKIPEYYTAKDLTIGKSTQPWVTWTEWKVLLFP